MRQPNYEQALEKCGVQWEYVESVPLDTINVTRGKLMQARLEPLDHSLIERYADMLNDGYEPPPLLLWRDSLRGKWTPLDGNQRLAANAECRLNKRRKEFTAYILKTDDPMVADRICWQWNNLVNGRRLSYEECMHHAITFVRKYNQLQTQACKDWGVKPTELWKRITDLEMRELAEANKIDVPKAIDCNMMSSLSTFRNIGEDVAVEAIRVVATNGLNHEDVKQLNKEVRKATTVKEKVKVIEQFGNCERVQRRKAETKGGTAKITNQTLPRTLLQKQLDQLDKLLNQYTKPALVPVGKEDKDEYIAKAMKVTNRLIDTYGLGAFLNDQRDTA